VEPFRYPSAPYARRHGPRGYAAYDSYRPWLRDEFSFRCVYCLAREQWGRVIGSYDLDHFIPLAKSPDRELEYDNLLYTCRSCNAAKTNHEVPDPLQVFIHDQVVVFSDGRIEGRSHAAWLLIRGLALDSAENVAFRRMWIDVVALARQYDPELLRRLMRYPDDLPDLARLRPPGGNSRPEGIAQSHFARRARGELAEVS
jgi:hypothetical protein